MMKYLFSLILLFAAFLLLYRLHELMFFIGDVGWFYLSARDMLLTGNIPLVGIPSSHPWLHQGPIWTYFLGVAFALTKFHPVSGAYVSVLFGLGTVYMIYRFGKDFFSEKTGLIATLLYGTSPLVIIHARMPYHTAPIPFFSLLLLFSVAKWIKGNRSFFPLAVFCVSMLYNFELATILYGLLFGGILLFGIVRKKKWARELKNKKTLSLSLSAFFVPLLPLLFYDTQHGFPQTLQFGAWMGYKVLTAFGYPSLHPEYSATSMGEVITFFFSHMQKLLFLPNYSIGVGLFFLSFFGVTFLLYEERKKKKYSLGVVLLEIFLLVGLAGFFAAKTISEAYLPMLFPFLILSLAVLFVKVWEMALLRFFAIFLVIIVAGNVSFLLQQNYLMGIRGGYGPPFQQRLEVSETIVKEVAHQEYTMNGRGPGSQFEGFVMPYVYLTWWKGHEPVKTNGKIQITVIETPEKIRIEKKEVTR